MSLTVSDRAARLVRAAYGPCVARGLTARRRFEASSVSCAKWMRLVGWTAHGPRGHIRVTGMAVGSESGEISVSKPTWHRPVLARWAGRRNHYKIVPADPFATLWA